LALGMGVLLLLAPSRSSVDSSDERLRSLNAEQHEPDSAPPSLERRPLRSSMPALRRVLGNTAWAENAAADLLRANIKLRVGEYLLVRVLAGVAMAVLPFVLLQSHAAGLIVAGVGGMVGFMVPAYYVRFVRDRRVARIEAQLIEFLPALGSSLRSGFAFKPAVEAAALQVSAPLGDELGTFLNDLNLGADSATALQDMGDRVGSRDLDVVITAIQVQRTTGGNLPEILDAAASALRDRERIRGEVKTFTAQQRMTGLVLSVYPVLVGLLLLAIMPSVWSKLFTETAGQMMLAIAVVLQVVGFLAIQRALKIEV
ncbi:MAG: type II secretion system F family protein, partial [Chloroflexi bacterium]|nr:type II secretion system F family protein [Chloroflexota bacterium]